MESENLRLEKLAAQKSLADEKKAIQYEADLLLQVQEMVVHELARVHRDGVEEDKLRNSGGGSEAGADSGSGCPTNEGDTENVEMCQSESQPPLASPRNTHVNIGVWLHNIEKNSLLSRVLDFMLPIIWGTEYVQSSVPLVDLLMYSVGLSVTLLITLILFIVLAFLFVLLKFNK